MTEGMIKVCYVFYGEEIWTPLIRRQVLELLEYSAAREKRLRIRVATIYPWYWHITKRKQFRDFELINSYPFELRFLPMLFPLSIRHIILRLQKKLTFFPHQILTNFSLFIMGILVSPILFKYYLIDGFSIFHCRSYPASSIILKFKKLCPNAKLIFDPRSDYPEENVTRNLWKTDSLMFRFWKNQERLLLKNSDMTICITRQYLHHYQKSCQNFKYAVIPNNVDCCNFRFNRNDRTRIREKYGFEGKVVFCYLGTMDINSWHCPEVYADVILYYRAITAPYIFLFLVPPESRSAIDRVFQEKGIEGSEYIIVSPGYSEVPQFLSAADFGLFYLKDKKIALSTKVVEYNSAGLPVLVNSNAISAASYVREVGTGMVIDVHPGDTDSLKNVREDLNFEKFSGEFSRDIIAETARENFDNGKVATEYMKIYRSLIP